LNTIILGRLLAQAPELTSLLRSQDTQATVMMARHRAGRGRIFSIRIMGLLLAAMAVEIFASGLLILFPGLG